MGRGGVEPDGAGLADAPGAPEGAGVVDGAVVSGVVALSAWIDWAMSRTCIRASPIAVPSCGRRLSSADLSWAWSVVGLTRVTGCDANATMPTRILGGSWSMNDS